MKRSHRQKKQKPELIPGTPGKGSWWANSAVQTSRAEFQHELKERQKMRENRSHSHLNIGSWPTQGRIL